MYTLLVFLLVLLAGCGETSGDGASPTPNIPPTVTFISPVEGATVRSGAVLSLAASVSDTETPPDALVVTFTSSLDGVLTGQTTTAGNVVGLELDKPLSVGAQLLTVTVTDAAHQSAADEVQLNVVANAAPVVRFLEPSAGESILAGSDVTIRIEASDDFDPASALSLEWGDDAVALETPDTLTLDGTASYVVHGITAGSWLLSVTVSDSEHASARAEVAFTVSGATDADGDGFSPLSSGGTDCDDHDPDVHPAALELCNAQDDDCDTEVDEGLTLTTYYADRDADGSGDPGDSITDCAAPEDFVDNGLDCDDSDPAIHPEATEVCNGIDEDCDGSPDNGVTTSYYEDDDGDGHGNALDVPVQSCTAPDTYAISSDDCDDTDPLVSPDAAEQCNGQDDNCNTQIDEAVIIATWYRDADNDGYGISSDAQDACTQPTGFVAQAGDCDDTNASVHPGAIEQTNSIDDDCDTIIDETVCKAYPVGTSPVGVIYDGTYVWVANESSNNVYQLNRDTGETLKIWAAGRGAQYMAYDGARVWVTNPGDGTVTVIDAKAATTKTYSTGGQTPDGITFDGSSMWVGNYGSSTIVKISASDGSIQKTVTVGKNPRFPAFDGQDIWISVSGADQVARIRASTGELLHSYPIASYPYAVTFDGTNIWVTQGLINKVAKLDMSTGEILGAYPAGSMPNGMTFDGSDLWITNQVSSTVPFPMTTVCTLTRVRPSDGALLGTYTVGERPQWVAADGQYIWVTNGSDNTVSKCQF